MSGSCRELPRGSFSLAPKPWKYMRRMMARASKRKVRWDNVSRYSSGQAGRRLLLPQLPPEVGGVVVQAENDHVAGGGWL